MNRQTMDDKTIYTLKQYRFVSPPFFYHHQIIETWSVFEPQRLGSRTPLGIFLEKLLKNHSLTIRDACKIAECSPSVLHGWIHGAYPTDTVVHLKKLCNRYGYTLAEALTGSPDQIVHKKNK